MSQTEKDTEGVEDVVPPSMIAAIVPIKHIDFHNKVFVAGARLGVMRDFVKGLETKYGEDGKKTIDLTQEITNFCLGGKSVKSVESGDENLQKDAHEMKKFFHETSKSEKTVATIEPPQILVDVVVLKRDPIKVSAARARLAKAVKCAVMLEFADKKSNALTYRDIYEQGGKFAKEFYLNSDDEGEAEYIDVFLKKGEEKAQSTPATVAIEDKPVALSFDQELMNISKPKPKPKPKSFSLDDAIEKASTNKYFILSCCVVVIVLFVSHLSFYHSK